MVFLLNMNGANLIRLLKTVVSKLVWGPSFLGLAHANTSQKWEVVLSPVANAPAVVVFFHFTAYLYQCLLRLRGGLRILVL